MRPFVLVYTLSALTASSAVVAEARLFRFMQRHAEAPEPIIPATRPLTPGSLTRTSGGYSNDTTSLTTSTITSVPLPSESFSDTTSSVEPSTTLISTTSSQCSGTVTYTGVAPVTVYSTVTQAYNTTLPVGSAPLTILVNFPPTYCLQSTVPFAKTTVPFVASTIPLVESTVPLVASTTAGGGGAEPEPPGIPITFTPAFARPPPTTTVIVTKKTPQIVPVSSTTPPVFKPSTTTAAPKSSLRVPTRVAVGGVILTSTHTSSGSDTSSTSDSSVGSSQGSSSDGSTSSSGATDGSGLNFGSGSSAESSSGSPGSESSSGNPSSDTSSSSSSESETQSSGPSGSGSGSSSGSGSGSSEQEGGTATSGGVSAGAFAPLSTTIVSPVTTTIDHVQVIAGPSSVQIGSKVVSITDSAQVQTVVQDGHSFTVDGSQIIAAGTTLSIPQVTTVATPTPVTVGSIIVSIDNSRAIIGGTTFSIGSDSSPTTIVDHGTTISIGPGGVGFPSQSTTVTYSPFSTVVADGLSFTVDASDAIISGTTYKIGPGATPTTIVVGGHTVSIGTNGVDLPTTTVHPYTASKTLAVNTKGATASPSAKATPHANAAASITKPMSLHMRVVLGSIIGVWIPLLLV